jgi:protein-tyrosine phosphatase
MIDLHSHILPGVDDGARTMADSIGIARETVNDGVTAIVATPHVREDYPTGGETMERLVGEVRAALTHAGIPLDVRTGGEVALGPLMAMGTEELRRFSLGGGGRYVLVEFPYYGWPLPLLSEVTRLRSFGVTAIIAHPERSSEIHVRPGRLGPLVDAGALVQLTAASVDGRLGGASRATAMRLLEMGLAHIVASDAHMPGTRAAGLSSAVAALGRGPLARWLTDDVPSAVLAGEAIPRRPPEPARRRRSWRRG